MAQLFPGFSSCQGRMTPGERKLARKLIDCLDDNCLIWYEVAQRHRHQTRYPDFIVLHPEHGLLFLEVKDWKLDNIKMLNPTECELLTDHGLKHRPHPLEQVRQVAHIAANSLKRNPALLQTQAPYHGNLLFPYDYGVLFANITREQMTSLIPEDALERLLPTRQTLFKEDIAPSVDASTFQNRLMTIFEKRFPCKLERNHIDAIRWHLFPEIRVGQSQESILFADEETLEKLQVSGESSDATPPSPTPLPDILRVMDLEQERLARNLGEGHRVIHGVAGSGKTLILGYRCLHLAQALRKPILVLCFNITLASKLRRFFAEKNLEPQKIQVHHFHGWCSEQCKTFAIDTSPHKSKGFDASVHAVIHAIENNQIPHHQYGAVLIDEGHDFHAEWLKLATQMVDPSVNSLLLLYDDAQSIYKKGTALEFSLSSVGIQAQGRTSILKLNYRNTREITQFAWNLTRDALQTPRKNTEIPQIAPQSGGLSGEMPVLRQFSTLSEEMNWVIRCLRRLHEKHHIAWRDMAILYPIGATGEEINKTLEQEDIPCVLLMTSQSRKKYQWNEEKIPILSIKSSKGLEFSTVFLVDSSFLYDNGTAEENLRNALRLLYVGMTRATTRLVLSFHRENALSKQLLLHQETRHSPEFSTT